MRRAIALSFLHNYRPLFCALVLTGLPAACGTPPYSPWIVPKRLFRERVSVIAVLPPRTDVPGLKVSTLTAPLESELRALGYTVVPSAQIFEIWMQLRDKDTTGETSGAGGAVVARQQAVDRLEAFRIDAWVRPKVVVVSADYQGWTALWHGVTQTIETTNGSTVSGAWLTRGQVPALSLEVTIENYAGTAFYRGYGGIELLKQRKGFVFVAAQPGTRLTDSTRNRTAVRVALKQLGHRSLRPAHAPQIAMH